VVLAGAYGGLSDSFDGASHQAILDIAMLRALPNMVVIVPADAEETKQALKLALRRNGPTFIRGCRNETPVLFEGAEPFQIGKARKLRDGKDLTIAACGIPVLMAMEAAERLAKDGIGVDLLAIATVKPIDEKALRRRRPRRAPCWPWRSTPSTADSAGPWPRRWPSTRRPRWTSSASRTVSPSRAPTMP